MVSPTLPVGQPLSESEQFEIERDPDVLHTLTTIDLLDLAIQDLEKLDERIVRLMRESEFQGKAVRS